MKVVLNDAQIEYDENVLKVIAQAAAGGMRDALSMLDQVVSFSGDKMTIRRCITCNWFNWSGCIFSIRRCID